MALSLLESGASMCGLNLQWGSFSVATLQELLYTESVFDAFSHDIRSAKNKKDNKDRVSSVQLGEEITLLGVPGDTLQGHMKTHTPESHRQDFAKDADHTYFRDASMNGGIQPEGSLPQTFYMSQYRRDATKTQRMLDLNRNWDARNKDSLHRITGKRL
uniref:Uncharacterized protein n=1 Tax=Tetraselmis chuii TaxID=63592 RepID=A0A7S1XAG1_9CHLO